MSENIAAQLCWNCLVTLIKICDAVGNVLKANLKFWQSNQIISTCCNTVYSNKIAMNEK